MAPSIFKPDPKYALAMTTLRVPIPKSCKVVMVVLEWRDAMVIEFKAMKDNGTWLLVPQQSEDNVINMRWIFKNQTEGRL